MNDNEKDKSSIVLINKRGIGYSFSKPKKIKLKLKKVKNKLSKNSKKNDIIKENGIKNKRNRKMFLVNFTNYIKTLFTSSTVCCG